MEEKICIIRSNDMEPDPRVQKYIDFYHVSNLDFLQIGWNRLGKNIRNKRAIFFNKKAKFGSGYANILKLFKWNIFILKTLIKHRRDIKIIHACDFDTVIPSIFFAKLFNKKVIFDIFDLYEDSRNYKSRIIKKIISIVEQFCIKKADKVIICEEERKCQLKSEPKELIIIPNIPNVVTDFPSLNNKNVCDVQNIVISYVGVLTNDRCIAELLELIKTNGNFILNIAGFGPLEAICSEYENSCDRIKYHGTVEYLKGLELMYNSHYIWAFYDPIIPNNVLAAPNKFYESLFLGVPIITSKNTLIGEKVEKYRTGITIKKEEISELGEKLKNHRLEYSEYASNCTTLWKNKYSDYLQKVIPLIYRFSKS